ncbi:e2669ade-b099-4ce4-8226-50c1a0827e6b [Thermothielavioides terrestris]|uniref:E2669ade-b099-4ce4-8226-50c1a0827e6b n=1 Tax=Thermothielavioides terrestris TaxID=2587410 RepID=A0A446BNK6_9PEZI|nr:e2669ade-b099-4ce4-8226-50c1a0827e6b [Thermothielavioides terrestris]
MPIFNHMEESGEEVLEQIRFLTYSRRGSGAAVFTRPLAHSADLQSWLERQENESSATAGTPPGDTVVLVPYESGTVHEDVSNLTTLSAAWRVPGGIMRHLLRQAGDHELDASRDGVVDLGKAQESVSTSITMQTAERLVSLSRSHAHYLRILKQHAQTVLREVRQAVHEGADLSDVRVLVEMATNAERFADACSARIGFLGDSLDSQLKVYLTMIQIHSMGYVRENLISVRRIAESNDAQADELRKYAKESREDARDMKRLAFLTMSYLPSTVVATFFSTPFLDLDDNLEFKGLSKLWIVMVISVALTALTFVVSALWDLLSRMRERANENSKAAAGGETARHNVDRSVLEPAAWVDPQLIRLQELLAKAAEREGSDGGEHATESQEGSAPGAPVDGPAQPNTDTAQSNAAPSSPASGRPSDQVGNESLGGGGTAAPA